MTHLLVALLLASNGSGKELVRNQQGTIVPIVGLTRPLITPDANRVVQVWFSSAGIQDKAGNSWAMNGTVPIVPRAAPVPTGSGPFSAVNYWSLPGSVAGFGGDFTMVIVGKASSTASAQTIFSKTNVAGSTGYDVTINSGGRLAINNRALGTSSPTTTTGTTDIFVACVGRSGTTQRAKLNLGTIAETTVTISAETTQPAMIGRWNVNTSATASAMTIYEVYATTTAATDALCTSIATEVKAKLAITVW